MRKIFWILTTLTSVILAVIYMKLNFSTKSTHQEKIKVRALSEQARKDIIAFTNKIKKQNENKIEVAQDSAPSSEEYEESLFPSSPPQAKDPATQTIEEKCLSALEDQVADSDFIERNNREFRLVIGDWFLQESEGMKPVKAEPPTSTVDKFFQALGYGDFLVGRALESNTELALKLLKEVHEDDPQNSAPLLYAAVIEESRNNTSEADRLFELAKKTSRFDTYVTTIAKEIHKPVRKGSDLIKAYAFWARAPIPYYGSIQYFLEKRDAKVFAKQMMKSGLDDSAIYSDVDYFIVDYVVGEMLYKAQNPKTNIPSSRAIIRRKQDLDPISVNKILNALTRNCDMSVIDDYADRLFKHLDKK